MQFDNHNQKTTRRKFIGATSALILLGGGLIAGCGGGEAPTADNSASTGASGGGQQIASAGGADKLTGAGATFPYPIYAQWFDTYKKDKNVEINYQSVGSGAGIKQLTAKTVDFGASDAPLKDDEALNNEVVHIPTVAGAVVLAYNLDGVPTGLKMSGETLADIYLGKIKKWNDPKITADNAGVNLPDQAITVARRSDGSGTSFVFTSYLAEISSEWKTKVGAGKSVDWPVGIGGKGNSGVAGVVKQQPGGLGYVELAYAEQNKLPVVALKNKAGKFIVPSVDSITAAAAGAIPELKKDVRAPIMNSAGEDAYPIAAFTYILAYKKNANADKAKALTTFLEWAVTDGQEMAKKLFYAPLPAELVEMNKKTLAEIQ